MKLIKKFLEELNSENIPYVHWKSNTNIKDALNGFDDLDILIDPSSLKKTKEVLRLFKFVRAFSKKDNWQSGIVNYVGLDINSQKLVHVHLHYELTLGYDYDKCFSLPILKSYLRHTTYYKKTISLPSYENEYCILVIRLILKNCLTPFILNLPNKQLSLIFSSKSLGIVRGSSYNEFLDLKSKVDQEKIKNIFLNELHFLDFNVFKFCEDTLSNNNSIFSFFKAGIRLKRDLAQYRSGGELISFIKSFFRLNYARISIFLNNLGITKYITGKKPQNGGRIIAFIGGDGSGKSTTIERLKKTLSKQFAVESIHIGKPKSSLQGFLFKFFGKLFSVFGLKNISKAFIYISIAINRKYEFKKACKLRDKGVIVLQDRMPLNCITAMDSPKVHTLLNGRFKTLSKYEKKQYEYISGVDKLFVLKLNPELALKRRPYDNPEELRIRSGQIWEKSWSQKYITTIDTNDNNINQVQKIVLTNIWDNINKPFIKTEIIGLNGTGKTSLFNQLKKSIPNIEKNIIIWNYPKLIIKSLFVNSFYCFKIILKTKKINLAHIYFHYKTSLIIIEKWKTKNRTPNKNIIFDQGPIFQLAYLHKEKCISKNKLGKELEKLNSILNNLILLKSSTDLLFVRVKNRINSDGRGQNMNFEEFQEFCESYTYSFNLIKKSSIPLFEINSEENNIKDMENKFFEIVYEKRYT